jgi:hypothetical protein
VVKIFVVIALLSTVIACRSTTTAYPNVVIIAVDNLGVNQVNCAKESHLEKSGIELLCQESVRFTHAFTTSPLATPALASILTGQYPYQHKVRTNGKDFLPSQIITPAELAQRQGVATAFFSGGPPVLRKSNLHQGFEVFDDHLNPTMNRFFRSFAKTEKIFQNWINDLGKQSFLSVFYVPDLNYPDTQTQTEMGEVRNLTFESQLEELDVSLFRFFQFLKNRKLWDSTQIILVGLNGNGSRDRRELKNNNLFSDRTQVGLLVKPVQKKPRDQGLQWSVDENVTIADIGASLLKLYSSQFSSATGEFERDFPIQPLDLSASEKSVREERPILLESAWAAWQEGTGIRYALRWDAFLVLINQRPQVYNSLIDHMETSPSYLTDGALGKVYARSLELAEKWKWPAWTEMSIDSLVKWKGLSQTPVDLESLANQLRADDEIAFLYGLELLNKQNWQTLQRWARNKGLKEMEMIAAKNLNQPAGKGAFTNSCLAKDPQACEDSTALALLDWVSADIKEDAGAKDGARLRFLRMYFQQKLDETISFMNWRHQGIWDISNENRRDIPVVEKMLALPELQKYRQISLRALQQLREEQ